jgi:ABC-type Na+ efflux pump permease subunit
MKDFKHLLIIFAPLFIIHLFFIREAYAYLDPGTGSYMFQIIIAMLIGVLYSIKLFWSKIVIFVKNLFSKKGINKKS